MTIESEHDMPVGAGQAIAQTWDKLRPEQVEADEMDEAGSDTDMDDADMDDVGMEDVGMEDVGIADAIGIGTGTEGGMSDDPFAEETGDDLESLIRQDDNDRETTLRDITPGL